jgi:hypothetical protein
METKLMNTSQEMRKTQKKNIGVAAAREVFF